jgi:hypothetical protein
VLGLAVLARQEELGARSSPFTVDRTTVGAKTIRKMRCDSTRCGLHEAGMISSSPNKLLVERTDWRFLNELKRELKV